MSKIIPRLNDSDKKLDDYIEEIVLKISEKMLELKKETITTEFLFLDFEIELPPDINLCFKSIMNNYLQN